MQKQLWGMKELEDLTPFEESENFRHDLTLVLSNLDPTESNNKILFEKYKVPSPFFVQNFNRHTEKSGQSKWRLWMRLISSSTTSNQHLR